MAAPKRLRHAVRKQRLRTRRDAGDEGRIVGQLVAEDRAVADEELREGPDIARRFFSDVGDKRHDLVVCLPSRTEPRLRLREVSDPA